MAEERPGTRQAGPENLQQGGPQKDVDHQQPGLQADHDSNLLRPQQHAGVGRVHPGPESSSPETRGTLLLPGGVYCDVSGPRETFTRALLSYNYYWDCVKLRVKRLLSLRECFRCLFLSWLRFYLAYTSTKL